MLYGVYLFSYALFCMIFILLPLLGRPGISEQRCRKLGVRIPDSGGIIHFGQILQDERQHITKFQRIQSLKPTAEAPENRQEKETILFQACIFRSPEVNFH